jgi:hypothetical protein
MTATDGMLRTEGTAQTFDLGRARMTARRPVADTRAPDHAVRR